MTDADLTATVTTCLHRIAPEADLATLDPRANLRESLDLDSFDFLQFLITLSQILHLDIPEADYPKLSTLDSLMTYLKNSMD
jgi:acyl carrier protein